jgi:pyruvate/2-oxoglutarate dehydrogenase complex dihydrolipoamide acyltransferase (E2) component
VPEKTAQQVFGLVVTGSGRGGRILRADVEAFAARSAPVAEVVHASPHSSYPEAARSSSAVSRSSA